MYLNGYLITSNTEMDKIIERIKELGIQYYSYRNIKSIKIIFLNNRQYIYFETEKDITNEMILLGYSFEGLIETKDKWDEIEQFGKYRCIINRINENIPNVDILDSII